MYIKILFLFLQRMDLGECIKVHDLALRADYEIASKEQEYFFELDVSFTHEREGFQFFVFFVPSPLQSPFPVESIPLGLE